MRYKNLTKIVIKNIEKSFKKGLTIAKVGGIICKLSARHLANSDASTSDLPIGKRRSLRPTNEYLTEFVIAELEMTLKIKQCKPRTKTHKIPVKSYSV